MGRTFADSSEAVASGDTTETSLGTITLSAKAKRIIGVWVYASAAAAMTTAESLSGVLRLDSPDFSIAPFKIPCAMVNVLTSGAIGYEPRILPVNIPCSGNGRVTGYITKDMAETGAVKARFGLVYEGDE